jgi:DNA adenine methylase
MKVSAPLRYPGGKASLAPVLSSIFRENGLDRPVVAEPYAGGAGACLALLLGEHADSILINDLDYRVFSFWWAALKYTDQFLARIRLAPLSIAEWHKQRDIYRNPRANKRFDVGFATFYLNRTNRSGILVNGGPIGGVKQSGKWGLDARFNRGVLAGRVERLSLYRERISIFNLDALEFAEMFRRNFASHRSFLYLDPPYYEKGADLYLSLYTHKDHVSVGRALASSRSRNWALTYDDVPPIRRIYGRCRLTPFKLRYTANHSRTGKELLITPKSLLLPASFRGLLP